MVFGVNSGSETSHQQFSEHNQFPFPLLIDTSNQLLKDWGLPRSMLGLIPTRMTCVVDINGVLRAKIQSIRPDKHSQEALSALRQINLTTR